MLRPSKTVGAHGLPELIIELGDRLIYGAKMHVSKQLELYARMVEEVARHADAPHLDHIVLYVAGHRRLITCMKVHPCDTVLMRYAEKALLAPHVNQPRFVRELARRLHWAASAQQFARQLVRTR